MTRLTKYEKETIILTNEEDDFWNVFTYNKGLQRRFMSFAEQYTEERRKVASERAKLNGFNVS